MENLIAAVKLNKEALIKTYANLYNEVYVSKADYNQISIEKVYTLNDDSVKYKVFILIGTSDGKNSYIPKSLSAYCVIHDKTEEEAISEINNISSAAGNESE